MGGKNVEDVGTRQHLVQAPMGGAADVHVFDKAYLGIDLFAVFDQVDEFVVVVPLHGHRVELQAGEPDLTGCLDALQHAGVRGAAGQFREPLRAQGVEADGDAVQTCRKQVGGLVGKQHPVGGQRQIVEAGIGGQHLDKHWQVAAQQRLAAGEADFLHPQLGKQANQGVHLLERQQVLARQPDVLLFGHAVLAAQVAAVGDGEAQVGHGPVEHVGEVGSWGHDYRFCDVGPPL